MKNITDVVTNRYKDMVADVYDCLPRGSKSLAKVLGGTYNHMMSIADVVLFHPL